MQEGRNPTQAHWKHSESRRSVAHKLAKSYEMKYEICDISLKCDLNIYLMEKE